jgi:hypothetical protein
MVSHKGYVLIGLEYSGVAFGIEVVKGVWVYGRHFRAFAPIGL